MKKAIVCTTINPPTRALEKFREMTDWRLIVVGDEKTPHEAYAGWDYLSPKDQQARFRNLSSLIGWNCIQRRNIGFVEAYLWGADVVATVDDDNIPLDNWGSEIVLHRSVIAAEFKTEQEVFDPLTATKQDHLWHRGFPHPLIEDRKSRLADLNVIAPAIQAHLWNGAPDIDAVARLVWPGGVVFDDMGFFFSKTISPFNSQNTFIRRDALPYYFMYPGVGRFDDIWASYHVQQAGFPVVYGPATVFQERNPHSLIADMKAEMYGYEHTLGFIHGDDVLPDQAKYAFAEYQRLLA